MREIRSSGSVEGVVSNHDPYSDSLLLLEYFSFVSASFVSASATSARRCVIEYSAERSAPPILTTVGPSPRAFARSPGRGGAGAVVKPSVSQGVSDRRNTEL